MVIRDVEQSRFQILIVISDKIIIGVSGHVGCRNFYILIAGDVHACRIVAFVILTGGDGKCGNSPFSMVHDGMNIRRKDRKRIIINRNRGICPPQKGLGKIRMIIKLAFDFNVGLSRIKGDSGHPFCAIHLVRLTDIYGAGTVVIGGKCIIDW